jgi:transposase-like protein
VGTESGDNKSKSRSIATRPHFTKEFKRQAIPLLEQFGKAGTALAPQSGVRRNPLQ